MACIGSDWGRCSVYYWLTSYSLRVYLMLRIQSILYFYEKNNYNLFMSF